MKALLVLALVLVASDARASSVGARAMELLGEVARRDGFVRPRVSCSPWKGGGYVCEICYSHLEHYLGWARVWCNATRCEWVLGADDPRMRGHHMSDECRR